MNAVLKLHQKTRFGIKFQCILPQCRYISKWKHFLRKYILSHSEGERFECDFNACKKVPNIRFILEKRWFLFAFTVIVRLIIRII